MTAVATHVILRVVEGEVSLTGWGFFLVVMVCCVLIVAGTRSR